MKQFLFEEVSFILGSNSKENWRILEDAEDHDTWVHLHDHPSPYVIIKKQSSEVETHELDYAGMLCKSHSKLKDVERVKMTFLKVRYVVKGKRSGEAKLLRAPDVKLIRSYGSIPNSKSVFRA
jgi:predicted ribosome quality control (RQC) complex YloA/Tae2 family protein